ncbi:hypothetical protein [Campylobacter vulpis]|uniref:Flagellar basal body-associated FliL family protein n=1 Tax=Campylobacter vulpis TaxID=1655500 RepID=A0A2G4R183_9BACT|nr:hypothetical protein [Campylobacter vulpis]MBS4234892.1 hypothetical protein [Campylobacter vulpis]MBS4240600.1 hypothetical protein [Campylobacter vulpis]MBS4276027.1 hypothetical protein [Campylobacter vulpis]MBS4306182.1 hypothetical protein [Campylobacter vulpis]MBS4313352.1 hypothetical protein [Campylobacter vulpis]
MKKIILSLILPLFLSAEVVELEKLRTELYSKSGVNVLKKIEISLEFEGKNLKHNEKKLTDSVNTVISGFFYEDIFTELGKNNFKKTLSKFVDKKYKIKLNDIYILSLSGVEKFDIEEFKRFLESTDAKNVKEEVKESVKDLENAPKLEIPKVQVPQIETNLSQQNDNLSLPKIFENLSENEEKREDERIDPKLFELSKNIEAEIKRGLSLENNTTGFELEFDANATQN